MPRLPRISGKETIRALRKLGFEKVRQRGSHVVLKKSIDGGHTLGCVVPLHSMLAVGTLKGILKQAKVTAEEFIAVL